MKNRIDFVVEATVGPAVLDIGCTGGLADMNVALDDPNWLHGRLSTVFGQKLWGIDLSERKINEMKSAGFSNLHVGDAQSFSLIEKFDTIVAGELIEHLPNPGLFLDAASRHLKTQGRLVLSTPYAAGLANVLYSWLKFPRTCANPEHTMWFCPSTLETLASMSGLRVVEWQLTADYPGEPVGLYGRFLRLYRLIGRFLPKRLRGNAFVAILEAK
jgi:SAM-dependent methyltransferase